MAAGMTLVGAGILWATQVPVHGHYWANLAGPLFLAGSAAFAFIPVSIGAQCPQLPTHDPRPGDERFTVGR
jgi:hypothetical protein